MFIVLMTPSRGRRRKLLVVGAVFVVLAAIAILAPIYSAANYANQIRDCQLEYRTVQLGLYGYLTYNKVDTLTSAGPTNNMTTPVKLTPRFVHDSSTVFAYTWDSKGTIHVISENAGGPPIPAGCEVTDFSALIASNPGLA